ncbi:uncharacterized protein LOC108704738 isoform X2 [Xenopus laevis]|uniref:Uncharacterized protein LOC108704738 isoform X2 n=1 Tax=Xenopus laevis TaxID=8355 RepID=A0A8J1LQK9_XENLA|nr:uncharacterized protein LOC108704738 isoform X2 [Xenopus laevis]
MCTGKEKSPRTPWPSAALPDSFNSLEVTVGIFGFVTCASESIVPGAVLEVTAPSTQIYTKGSDILIPCTFHVDKFPADPKFLAIKWYFNGKQILSYDYDVSTTDPRFSLNSTTALWGVASLSVSNTQVSDGGRYTCTVTYSPEQHEKEIILTIQAAPSIHITHEPFYENKEQTLMCRVWGYYPESIAVSWLVNGSRVEASEIKRINSSALESSYQFLPTAESQGMEISCVVEHQALTQPLVQTLKVQLTDEHTDVATEQRHGNIQNATIGIVVGIVVIALALIVIISIILKCYNFNKKKQHNSPEEVVLLQNGNPNNEPMAPTLQEPVGMFLKKGGVVECTAFLHNFFPDSITVEWVYENKTIPSTFNRFNNEDGNTFDAESKCTILWPDFKNGVKIIWKHESMETEGKLLRELWVKDFPWRPVMSEIPTTDMYVGTETEIQCNISGYFPDNLTVTWYKKKENGREELVNKSGRYQIPDILSQDQPDQTLNCTARLFFSPSLSEEHGAEFICRVEHPILQKPIEKSTGPLVVRDTQSLEERLVDTQNTTDEENSPGEPHNPIETTKQKQDEVSQSPGLKGTHTEQEPQKSHHKDEDMGSNGDKDSEEHRLTEAQVHVMPESDDSDAAPSAEPSEMNEIREVPTLKHPQCEIQDNCHQSPCLPNSDLTPPARPPSVSRQPVIPPNCAHPFTPSKTAAAKFIVGKLKAAEVGPRGENSDLVEEETSGASYTD